MEVVPEVKDCNVDDNDCGGDYCDYCDYCDGFTFSAGDGDGGKAQEGS